MVPSSSADNVACVAGSRRGGKGSEGKGEKVRGSKGGKDWDIPHFSGSRIFD